MCQGDVYCSICQKISIFSKLMTWRQIIIYKECVFCSQWSHFSRFLRLFELAGAGGCCPPTYSRFCVYSHTDAFCKVQLMWHLGITFFCVRSCASLRLAHGVQWFRRGPGLEARDRGDSHSHRMIPMGLLAACFTSSPHLTRRLINQSSCTGEHCGDKVHFNRIWRDSIPGYFGPGRRIS
jgi:hypothetical protein